MEHGKETIVVEVFGFVEYPIFNLAHTQPKPKQTP